MGNVLSSVAPQRLPRRYEAVYGYICNPMLSTPALAAAGFDFADLGA
jgi:hypothetical protein